MNWNEQCKQFNGGRNPQIVLEQGWTGCLFRIAPHSMDFRCPSIHGASSLQEAVDADRKLIIKCEEWRLKIDQGVQLTC